MPKARTRKVLTVVGQFTKSLDELVTALKKTQPYFIRCLKPNAEQLPDRFDQEYVMQQMKRYECMCKVCVQLVQCDSSSFV